MQFNYSLNSLKWVYRIIEVTIIEVIQEFRLWLISGPSYDYHSLHVVINSELGGSTEKKRLLQFRALNPEPTSCFASTGSYSPP